MSDNLLALPAGGTGDERERLARQLDIRNADAKSCGDPQVKMPLAEGLAIARLLRAPALPEP